jgi:hypothetical protein
LIVLALMLFCGCTPAPQSESRVLSLAYRGVDLAIGDAADGVIAQLGDDYTMSEAESCAGQGTDRMYTYPSVRLYVFAPVDGAAVISSVSYIDDGVKTAEGLGIGCSSAEVLSALGDADEASDVRLVYRGKGSVLTFGLRDGVVVSIELAGD